MSHLMDRLVALRSRNAGLALLASVLLSGCASQSGTTEDNVGSFLVSPGKYDFYTCAHLAQMTVYYKSRENELEGLIAKAGPDAGGRLVSAIAYRSEYAQARGNLIELRKTETAKNCPPPAVVTPPAAAPKPKKR